MVVTPDGIVAEVNELQSLNAASPMEVTPSGIVTEVKELQFLNVASSMEVTPTGIITVVRFSVDIPFGTQAAVNTSGATPSNAQSPMAVTLEGIVTEVNELQP